MLAGVDYLFPLYREASKYPQLLADGVPGNHDDSRTDDLHQRAWEIVGPLFRRDQDAAWQRYLELSGSGKKQALGKVEDVVRAAVHGQVQTLFVARNLHCWGRYDAQDDTVAIHEREEVGGQDLLDLCAVSVLLNGGVVYAVEEGQLSDGHAVAAVLRY